MRRRGVRRVRQGDSKERVMKETERDDRWDFRGNRQEKRMRRRNGETVMRGEKKRREQTMKRQ